MICCPVVYLFVFISNNLIFNIAMDFLDLHKITNANLLEAGKLLIAQPFMADSTFARSVVLLCEHGEEGAIGFVLNQPTDVNIGDLLPDMYNWIHYMYCTGCRKRLAVQK